MSLPVQKSVLDADILELVARVDLNELTSKFVRNYLEKKHDVALKPFKSVIDDLIRDSIKRVYPDGPSGRKVAPQPASSSNGNSSLKRKLSHEPEPSPCTSKSHDEDAQPSAKASKVKSEEFVDDEDGGDIYEKIKLRRAAQRPVQRRQKEKKEREKGGVKQKRETAFTRMCILSDELFDILNSRYMRRSQVVKAMWQYFREKNLIDPKNKRFVVPDEKTKAVFGAKKFQVSDGECSFFLV